MSTTRKELLHALTVASIDTPVGSIIEDYCDLYGEDPDLIQACKKFLSSALRLNRSAVLRLFCGNAQHAAGLEGDVLLLHMQGKEASDNTDIAAVGYLYEMQRHGSLAAARILGLLKLDDWWSSYYGR